jgi:hypothetical protein
VSLSGREWRIQTRVVRRGASPCYHGHQDGAPQSRMPTINYALCQPGRAAGSRLREDAMPEFAYQDPLPMGEDTTSYRLLTREGVSVSTGGRRRFLEVEPAALTRLTAEAMRDIAPTSSVPAISGSLLTSSGIRRPRPTIGSSRSSCSRTRALQRAACCRPARTPARPSSWAKRASASSPAGMTNRRSREACSMRTGPATSGTPGSRRSTCTAR